MLSTVDWIFARTWPPTDSIGWPSTVTIEWPAARWTYVMLTLLGLYCFVRFLGLWVLETTTSWILTTFRPGVLPNGKPVSGPKWEFPNGSIVQRFIDGRASSEKWREYGPVYRIWNGPYPEIVITTPQDFKHFASDANDHGKPPNMNLGWYLGELLGRCMGLLSGADWKRLRKVFDPAFAHSAAVTRIETVDAAARRYVARLPAMAQQPTTAPTGAANKGGQGTSFAVSAVEAFTKFPYFLTASTLYGPMTAAEEAELWALTEQRMALNFYLLAGGPYRAKKTAWLYDRTALKRLRAYEVAWRAYHARLVAARRARAERPPIVGYWEECEQGGMSWLELLHTLDELLMLNLDVITHVITWLITLIAEHPAVERELRAEVAEHQADMLGYLARTDTHLHRCFTESMRIRPFTLFTPGECSDSVKNFHGVLVRPGTQILLDVLAINVRNPFWGAHSATFDPSRLKSLKSSDGRAQLRYNLHSFGIGSRKCMGQFVAGHIVKALTVHLFATYDVRVSDGRSAQGQVQQQPSPGGAPAAEKYDIDKSSWTPKAGTVLQLTRRA